MLKRRIIPCLDVKDGRTVKGIHFVGLQDAGDAVELAARYALEGADELVFLDISATNERRKTAAQFAAEVGKASNIPFSIGGGIASVVDARTVLLAGADKISLNTAAVLNPELITECAEKLGSQAVIIAIDAKQVASDQITDTRDWEVFIKGGKEPTGRLLLDWAQEAEKRGAGEILLTSIDKDGTKSGFDIGMINAVAQVVSIPVIASGGAGKMEHFSDLFRQTKATGALAASIFHYREISIKELKEYLISQGIPIRQ